MAPCESEEVNTIGVEYVMMLSLSAEDEAIIVLDSPAVLEPVVSPAAKEIILSDCPTRMDLVVFLAKPTVDNTAVSLMQSVEEN